MKTGNCKYELENILTKRWFIINEKGQKLGPFDAKHLRKKLRDGEIDPFVTVEEAGSSSQQELMEVDEIFASKDIIEESKKNKSANEHPSLQSQENSSRVNRRTEGASNSNLSYGRPRQAGSQNTKILSKEAMESSAKAVRTERSLEQKTTLLKTSATREELGQEYKNYRPEESRQNRGSRNRGEHRERKQGEGSRNSENRRSRERKERKDHEEQESFLGLADPSVESSEQVARKKVEKLKKYYIVDNGQRSKLMTAYEICQLYKAKKINSKFKVGKSGTKLEIGAAKFYKVYKNKAKNAFEGQLDSKQNSPKSNFFTSDFSFTKSPIKIKSWLKPLVKVSLLIGGALGLYFLLLEFQPLGEDLLRKLSSSKQSKDFFQEEQNNRESDEGKTRTGVNVLDSNNLRKTKKPPESSTSRIPSRIKRSLISTDYKLIAKLSRKDGVVVSIGPLFYSSVELKNCAVKCRITMRDSSKRGITVIFFKAAYISRLQSRGSPVSIKGRPANRGRTFYLSEVL